MIVRTIGIPATLQPFEAAALPRTAPGTSDMSRSDQDSALLRSRERDDHGRVTYTELFFDLVFVFAVTQLSHALLADLSAGGAVRILLLLLAVWWVWIFTSWVTNWF